MPEICIVNVNFSEALPRNNISSKRVVPKIVRTEPESDGADWSEKLKNRSGLSAADRAGGQLNLGKEEVKSRTQPGNPRCRTALCYLLEGGCIIPPRMVQIGRLSLHFVIIELSVSSYVQKQKMPPRYRKRRRKENKAKKGEKVVDKG